MKKIALFGYGKTTRAIAERLGPFTFYDDKVTVPQRDEKGNLLLPPMLFDHDRSDLQIPSPGIPPSHPLVKIAKNLISEYDLFISKQGEEYIEDAKESTRHYTIWISGTNGKTTTTKMVTHLLEKRGAVYGGNIGTPLAQMDPKAPIWVLETSSFTLHYTRYAKPDLYLLLPVTPDHIEWHGGEDGYLKDKLKPLAKMREGEAVILPKSFTECRSDGFKIGYDDPVELANYFGIDISKVKFEGAFLLDAVLALGVAKILFDELDYDKINSFMVDPHRQERVVDSKGRVWINDSKATNIDATIQALKPFGDKRVFLILGGDDKGVDLSLLFKELKKYDLKIFAIGSNASRVELMAKDSSIECLLCETLHKAVEMIDKEHDINSVALLSPAAASLDQFSSYNERGEIFKKIISGF
ncbi:MAG: UDP-N-acetylmuramoyl-L-alanine--D-glutamate ligase [Hydrogenimonas sp.]|nr:UDP-N-acetylmuramoyl-L-alanine--D-glutamate ligase [Hydrogenimonas sp.]